MTSPQAVTPEEGAGMPVEPKVWVVTPHGVRVKDPTETMIEPPQYQMIEKSEHDRIVSELRSSLIEIREIREIRRKERERAAMVCEERGNKYALIRGADAKAYASEECAAAIRALADEESHPQPKPEGEMLTDDELNRYERTGHYPAGWTAAQFRAVIARQARRANRPAPAGETASGWIPVSERLPDETDGDVFCATHGGSVDIYRYDLVAQYAVGVWPRTDAAITHWQPLPPPPSALRDGRDKEDL